MTLDHSPSTPFEIDTGETTIFGCTAGKGPPLLLLHGFPQTHIMWRSVLPHLTDTFSVVRADLRGYGRSGCRDSASDHSSYSKRAMARDMTIVMERLGFQAFNVCGHDRGGRVVYRMALDYPDRVSRLAVLDILPIETAWAHADARLALGYWPWTLLAQPSPLPEQILTTNAAAIVENALSQWGSPAETFPDDVRATYIKALADPTRAHAICEEYRAAATIDRTHDQEDLAKGRKIRCPVLVLWSARGPLDQWYAHLGGPLTIWRTWADQVQGRAIEGGHFFPEASPVETADQLARFFL